jgi:hypothetical protein
MSAGHVHTRSNVRCCSQAAVQPGRISASGHTRRLYPERQLSSSFTIVRDSDALPVDAVAVKIETLTCDKPRDG